MTQYTYSCKMVNKSSGVPSESEPKLFAGQRTMQQPSGRQRIPNSFIIHWTSWPSDFDVRDRAVEILSDPSWSSPAGCLSPSWPGLVPLWLFSSSMSPVPSFSWLLMRANRASASALARFESLRNTARGTCKKALNILCLSRST
jgi:hypothetical protein